MPRLRSSNDNSKGSRDRKDKRKERELRKLSDFWSKVTGDIIGPRCRMRTYKTNEGLSNSSEKTSHNTDIEKGISHEAKVPKIRISLRKQATIRIDNSTGSDDKPPNISSCSSISVQISGKTEQDASCNTNNCYVEEETSTASSIYESKPSNKTKVKLSGNLNKYVDREDNITHDEVTSKKVKNIPDSFTNRKLLPSQSDHIEDKDKSDIPTCSFTTKKKSIIDLLKNKQKGNRNCTRIEQLKPEWDTQLLCHDQKTGCGNSTRPPSSSDQSNNSNIMDCEGFEIISDGPAMKKINKVSDSARSNNTIKDAGVKGRAELMQTTPELVQLKLLTRSKTRTPEKFGLNKSRDDLFKSLPEPSPRKRKHVDLGIVNDIRLAKHACALWFSECRRQFQQRHPKASSQQLDELMREGWDSLTPRYRLPYFVRAKSALEDKCQERSKAGNKKRYGQRGLDQDCTLDNFLKMTVSEQEVTLKRRLYELQKQLSRAHYECFLETVMMQLVPTNHTANNHSDNRGIPMIRKELYTAILALQNEIPILRQESHAIKKINLLKKYHRDIANILNSPTMPLKENEISAKDDIIEMTDQKPSFSASGNVRLKTVTENVEANVRYTEIQSSQTGMGDLEAVLTGNGMLEYKTVSAITENTSNECCSRNIKPAATENTPNNMCSCCEDVLCLNKDNNKYYTDPILIQHHHSNVTDTGNGGCGDVASNDLSGSPTYKDILNYLKFGSAATGMLQLKVSDEDWSIPNVVNRKIYKEILLNSITDPLPVLDFPVMEDLFQQEYGTNGMLTQL